MYQSLFFVPDLALSVALLSQISIDRSLEDRIKTWPSDLKKALPTILNQLGDAPFPENGQFTIPESVENHLRSSKFSNAVHQLKLRSDFCSDFFGTRLKGAMRQILKKRGLAEVENLSVFQNVLVHVVLPGSSGGCLKWGCNSSDDAGKDLRIIYEGQLTDPDDRFPECVRLIHRLSVEYYRFLWDSRNDAMEYFPDGVENLNRVALEDAIYAAVEVQWLREDNADLEQWMDHLRIRS